jgi:hypothetical protein
MLNIFLKLLQRLWIAHIHFLFQCALQTKVKDLKSSDHAGHTPPSYPLETRRIRNNLIPYWKEAKKFGLRIFLVQHRSHRTQFPYDTVNRFTQHCTLRILPMELSTAFPAWRMLYKGIIHGYFLFNTIFRSLTLFCDNANCICNKLKDN